MSLWARIHARIGCAANGHDYRVVKRTVDGVTMGWDFKPHRAMTFYSACAMCGKQRKEAGMYVPGERAIRPELFNEAGWPIDAEGRPLRISTP